MSSFDSEVLGYGNILNFLNRLYRRMYRTEAIRDIKLSLKADVEGHVHKVRVSIDYDVADTDADNTPYLFDSTLDYWLNMSEGSGNPVDKIKGKVATLINGASWGPLNPYRNIQLLDASNQYIDLGSQTDLWSKSLTKFSFAFTVNLRSIPSAFPYFLNHGDGSAQSHCCYFIQSNGRFTFQIRNAANTAVIAQFTTPPTLGENYRVHCVYDNSLGSANLKIYVNGVQGSVTGNLLEAINLVVATTLSVSAGGMDGTITNFKFWDTEALSAAQVAADLDGVFDDIPTGGIQALFGPDGSEIKLWQKFSRHYGINGIKTDVTFNAVNYDALEIGSENLSYMPARWFYGVPDNASNWVWSSDHPSLLTLKNGYSISLNESGRVGQVVYVDNYGTDLDLAGQNFSLAFWFKITDLTYAGGLNQVLACRQIDTSNRATVEVDNADNKLFAVVTRAGVSTKQEFATPITQNSWNFCFLTSTTVPVVVLRVNGVAGVASVKVSDVAATYDGKMSFGNVLGGSNNTQMKGKVAMIQYYKHTTVLTTAEADNIEAYNDKLGVTPVTKTPFIAGYSKAA